MFIEWGQSDGERKRPKVFASESEMENIDITDFADGTMWITYDADVYILTNTREWNKIT